LLWRGHGGGPSGPPDDLTGSTAAGAVETAMGTEIRMRHLEGRWRIVEMDLWDQEAIDLVEPGFIELAEDGTGEFGFVAVSGRLDCRTNTRDGRPFVEFSWVGDDDGDEVGGRCWAALGDDDALTGHLYFHLGDDSGFRAAPFVDAGPLGRR